MWREQEMKRDFFFFFLITAIQWVTEAIYIYRAKILYVKIVIPEYKNRAGTEKSALSTRDTINSLITPTGGKAASPTWSD